MGEDPDDAEPTDHPAEANLSTPRPEWRRRATRPPLIDDVTAALRTLGVAVTAGALDAALSAAEKESLSHLEFLHRLLAGPAEAKRQRALERRIRAAEVPRTDDPGGFRLGVQRQGCGSAEHRATDDVRLRAPARERDPGGSDRPGQEPDPPSRSGHAACVLGYRVRYATSAKLLQEFTAALADGTFATMLDDYARFDLLLIDEFGFDRLGA